MPINWDHVTKNTKELSFEGRICKAKVVEVYDGDTVKIVFPLIEDDENTLYKWNCRLINIDTPELRTRNIKEKNFGIIVRDNLREKILNKVVDIHCKDFDKYGRLLIEIFSENNSINEWLIDNSYAKKYDGGKKSKWFTD
tara:strand:- start:8229 stop:8648 length:420 start_codon:yes stop_codon:yes gene_type:complete